MYLRILTLAAAGLALLAAETHTITAAKYYHVFSVQKPVLLRIKSGDTVVTRTVDSSGTDYTGARPSETGNPLTGPFYIEDAEAGDSIAVRLDKVRLNRATGYTSYRLIPAIVNPGEAEQFYKERYTAGAVLAERSDLVPWDLDLKRLTARPRLLDKNARGFEVPVRPMLGCIGVATPGETVLTSGPAGSHGGNMDYNDVTEGATVYLPVYHPGAYFYIGDGHAVQGDGEGLGSGVETSLDVQFTVTLRKKQPLSNPRLENDRYIISIGAQPEFSSSTDHGLRIANSDMLRWLAREYRLSGPEAHMLFGTVVEHKLVTYFGTVATLFPKRYLPRK